MDRSIKYYGTNVILTTTLNEFAIAFWQICQSFYNAQFLFKKNIIGKPQKRKGNY